VHWRRDQVARLHAGRHEVRDRHALGQHEVAGRNLERLVRGDGRCGGEGRGPGRALTRDELLRKVWGYDYVGETRTVDVHVRRLRAKLGEHHEMIETVLGAGYKLIAPNA